MRHFFIATSFVAVSLTAGCMNGGGFETREGMEAYRPVTGAIDGRLSGDIGPVNNLDSEATELSTYDDGYYISLETVVEMEDRAAMTLLSVSNGASIFHPGMDATFRLADNEDGLRVTMLGCVGQSPGVYDEYDAPADEVDVDVFEHEGGEEGALDVELQGRWYDRGSNGQPLETFRTAETRLTLLR